MAINRRRLNTWATITDISTEDASEFDKYGQPVATETSELLQVDITPQGSSEDVVDRDTRIQQYVMTLPPEIAINALSEVVWTDRFDKTHTATVEGEPIRHAGMRGPSHITANLKEELG